jgi:hypothetical protein
MKSECNVSRYLGMEGLHEMSTLGEEGKRRVSMVGEEVLEPR